MKQIQQSLFAALPLPKAPPVLRRRVSRPALKRRAPLWLAIHLPRLSLEALRQDQSTEMPRAVIDAIKGAARIVCVNESAEAHGVAEGMTLAAAWSLLPVLEVHERDPSREKEQLRRLLAWAQRFTPSTCLDDQAVLLEVRASLQLFGGAAALHARARNSLERSGFTVTSAMAPTPRAALWLARARRETEVDRPDDLPGVLGGLPLAVTGFDAVMLEKFRGIGARYLRDLLRLPRDGFARRYSPRLLRELDQALGRVPDVRRPVPPPQRFSTRFDLSFEVSETGRLLNPVEQLLHELDRYLRSTQQGVRRLQLQLVHRDKSVTPVSLGFANATRDRLRMSDLAQQKLESVTLQAPVLEIVLQADEIEAMSGSDRALFVEQQADEGWPQLVERLRTRLGEDAVSGIEQNADHRPERAWRFVSPGHARQFFATGNRPHWLLEEPQLLKVEAGAPVHGGPLRIIDGPERIETGWWDEADVTREYFTALDVHGRRLWICRETRSGRWWLQGVFE